MEGISCFCGGTVQTLSSREKEPAICELIRKTPLFSEVENLTDFQDCVLTREKLQSTGLGRGVAVAHGKTSLVNRVMVSLGISRKGIAYGSPDGSPVKLLFLIASPPDKHSEYLMALSTIARLFRADRFRKEILASTSPEEVENKIARAFHETLDRRWVKSGAFEG